MTTLDHAALRREAEAARDFDPKADWSIMGPGHLTYVYALCGHGYEGEMPRQFAEHVVAFSPAVALALLDEIDRLRAEVARMRKSPEWDAYGDRK